MNLVPLTGKQTTRKVSAGEPSWSADVNTTQNPDIRQPAPPYNFKRVSEQEAENHRFYVVVPVRPQIKGVELLTFGVTTHKKIVRKAYDDLTARNSFPPGIDNSQIPFIISKNIQAPQLVDNAPNDNRFLECGFVPQILPTMNPYFDLTDDLMEGVYTPGHNDVKCFKMTSTNDLEIVLTNQNPKTYHNCSKFDTALVQSGDFWHMIVVHHEGRVKRAEILEKLFEIVTDLEFFPVAYTESQREDYFLLRMCRGAIEKLFQSNLSLQFDSQAVPLTVKFQVAKFKLGQIYPIKKYQKVINESLLNLITVEGTKNVLNLNSFSKMPELGQICVNLANKVSLTVLFSTLDSMNTSAKIFEKINGLCLSNNDIYTLDPISKLPIMSMDLIDLRNNKIRTVHELVNLKRIKMKHLMLEGNLATRNINYVNDIREMFPDLERLDNLAISHSKSSTVATSTITTAMAVDITNLNDIFTATDEVHDMAKFKTYKIPVNQWHQVIIHHNGKLTQTEILDALFEVTNQFEFILCYYKAGPKFDSFLLRDCFDALEALYDKKLTLTTLCGTHSFTLTLKMRVAEIRDVHLDPLKAMQSKVGSRYDYSTRTLNLENFADEEYMRDIICRVSVPRTLSNLLTFVSRRYASNVDKLILASNELKSTRGMHPIVFMKSLKEIDLQNNKIEEVKQIESMPKTSLVALWLDGNPLCAKYSNATDYVKAVKELIPNLEMLDGQEINKPLYAIKKQNFLCSIEGYDLAEQFVQHYFTSFDSVNRARVLKGVYNQNAILTMSINSQGMPDNLAKQMAPIIDNCRNFKRVVSTKTVDKIFHGPDKISAIMGTFNQTEHDFTTFTIDLTSYTPSRAVITVNGLFKVNATSLNEEDIIMGFARTFVIIRTAQGLGMFHAGEKYEIVNDIVLYYRPSVYQLHNSFKAPAVQGPINHPIDDDDKRGLEIIFHELTGLNSIWCNKFLSASEWNFRASLESFTELLREQKIPPEAFN